MAISYINSIESILKSIGKFPKQKRYNIREEPDTCVRGAVLGDILLRPKDAAIKGTPIYPSKLTFRRKYMPLYEECIELMQHHDPTFEFSTIQINDNTTCAKHIDSNNVGESYIIGIGEYLGGELRVFGVDGCDYVDVNIKNKFYKFDGSKFPHMTLPFTGNRFSIVYYNIS